MFHCPAVCPSTCPDYSSPMKRRPCARQLDRKTELKVVVNLTTQLQRRPPPPSDSQRATSLRGCPPSFRSNCGEQLAVTTPTRLWQTANPAEAFTFDADECNLKNISVPTSPFAKPRPVGDLSKFSSRLMNVGSSCRDITTACENKDKI